MFFTEQSGRWIPLKGGPVFKMQDPFFTFIDHELIFGGVETFPRPLGGNDYKTIFFRGRTLDAIKPLTPFAEGPLGMKDIRLVDLRDGRIDPATGFASPIEIILKRENLTNGLRGPAKRPDLKDVLFSGGLQLSGHETILYVGAGDAEVHSQILDSIPVSFEKRTGP
jgi:hypothetical protein